MIINTAGQIREEFFVCGSSVYPIELLSGEVPVLFDGGVTCAGRLYRDSIREVLRENEPEFMFITHVHWDHCGAVAYLKDLFPLMKIMMSARAEEILKRQNALSQIKRLNAEAVSIVSRLHCTDVSRLIRDPFQAFRADVVLKDDQTISLGRDITVRAISTPGHTRDHVSYYIPEKKILIASEAAGCVDATGAIIVEFLADYDLYLSSLEKLACLPVEILCQGHRLVFVGREEIRKFFERSIDATMTFRKHVLDLLAKPGYSLEKVVLQIKAEQYDTNTGIKQPETPYLMNLRAQVKHLAEEA